MRSFIEKYEYLGVNQKFLTEQDFLWICENEGIEIIESDGVYSWYMTVESYPFIVLPKGKCDLSRLFNAFHELAHHFRHYGKSPNQIFLPGLHDHKDEFEADAFATICLVPKFALDSYCFLEDHPNQFAQKTFLNRQKLDLLYGI